MAKKSDYAHEFDPNFKEPSARFKAAMKKENEAKREEQRIAKQKKPRLASIRLRPWIKNQWR